MLDGFSVISKSGDGFRVTTREGVWDMMPQPDRLPVKKVAPAPKPVQKSEVDLIGVVEEVVSAALDEALQENPTAGLREDLSELTDRLDSAGKQLDAVQRSENELRDEVFSLLDDAASVMKFTGVPASGPFPMNIDDASSAALARRRGR